ncbi:thioredoxin domain-containing protein 9 isoform X2 [Callithrix jacchus]
MFEDTFKISPISVLIYSQVKERYAQDRFSEFVWLNGGLGSHWFPFQEWLSKGHGEYREIPSERDFFQEVKESKKVVCHFYRDSTFRCKILDRHLVILSKKHLETKFLKLNVEKAPFLCERLHIKVIPTLALVKDGKTQDYVVGFTDLGNTDDFTTETLEWRLGCSDILNYSGNLMEPPFQSQKKFGTNFTKLEKKTIRGKKYDSDSDDD